ncbi:unnamed protein product (macronuclear) [Paramecium tetraurelia]|uniref:HTH psq-type domain-containing protein n=1 Tax=Paramecium tetraurelia TaxID=5888 RepID=A0C2P7_PARTE|nr:uncharacterized protein GSPATT00034542001 [Paramecium tetraurelia]CAK65064.1 unnamed protein product [Paramecium tetraurelia]|eukprot:XP_001432461.1 hypothetical protein (macronuclear) [Paramecium tetraurelia strain d4-2]
MEPIFVRLFSKGNRISVEGECLVVQSLNESSREFGNFVNFLPTLLALTQTIFRRKELFGLLIRILHCEYNRKQDQSEKNMTEIPNLSANFYSIYVQKGKQMASPKQMDNRSGSQVQNDSKESQSDLKITQGRKIVKQKGKKYMKIRLNTKQQLYTMVQRQGMKIKDAAQMLGIKYATAKTIIFHQRQKRKAKRKCGERMCGYTGIVGNRVSRLKIICIIANQIVHQQDYNS